MQQSRVRAFRMTRSRLSHQTAADGKVHLDWRITFGQRSWECSAEAALASDALPEIALRYSCDFREQEIMKERDTLPGTV